MFRANSVHSFLDKADWNAEELANVLRQDSSSVNECPIACDPPLVRVLKSEKCSLDIVQLLLDYGADVNCGLPHRYSPLIVAVRSSRSETIIRELLQRKANVHLLDKYGQSCICNALQVSSPRNILKLLLEAGCSPNTCEDHVSVLHCASVSPKAVLDKDKLQLLLEAGADFHRFGTWEKKGRSPMCFALRAGIGVPGIKLLLSVGVSLNACNIHASAFFCAADSGWGAHLRTDVMKLLLKEGSCAGEGNGWTPLQRALRYCKYEVGAIKLLLDLPGVDVNAETVGWKDDTLLHLAVDNFYCDKDVVRLLLNQGAEVDKLNECDDTALLLAVINENCHPSVVDILLEKGSPVNTRNKYGKTPLGVAIELERSTVVVQLLLAAGARIGIGKNLTDSSSLLNLALSMYHQKQNQKRLECLKIILRYSLLENLNLASQYLLEKRVQFKTLSGFIKKCEQEVRDMKKKYVGGGRTLREFLAGSSQPQTATAESNPESTSYDFDQLLRITIDNDFPNYTDAISAKVGTTALRAKLQDLRMYTRPCSDMEKKIYLNYECIYRISQYSSMADLLRLMSAFCVSYVRPSCEVARKDLQIEGNDSQRMREHSNPKPNASDYAISEELSSSPSHHSLSNSSPPSISNALQRKNKSVDSSCFMSDSDKFEETPLKSNEHNQKHGVEFEHGGILKPKEIVQKKRVYHEKDSCILVDRGERSSEPYMADVESMKRCKVVLPTDDLKPIS